MPRVFQSSAVAEAKRPESCVMVLFLFIKEKRMSVFAKAAAETPKV